MSTVLEAALEAAAAVVAAAVAPVVVERDAPEPETVGAAGYVAILHGEPVDYEETIGVPHWSFVHAAEIEIQVSAGDGVRSARLAELHSAIAVAIESNRTLGGIVDRVVLGQPSTNHFVEERSGVPVGVLSSELRIEYQSSSSAG